MNAIITKTNGRTTIVIEGRLDIAGSPELEMQIQPLLNEADADILIDCSAMTYISSSGLRIFITLQKNVKKTGGRLVIKALTDDIKDVFEMTGFSSLFTIEN